MSILWDRATAQPELLIALNNLKPHNNMKIYSLLSKAWARTKLVLLKRTRNEVLVYNRARSGKRTHFA